MNKYASCLSQPIIDRLLDQIVKRGIVKDAEYVGRVGNTITFRAKSRRREYHVIIQAV